MRLKTKKFFEELKALSLLKYVKGGRTDLRTKYLLRSLLALKNTGLAEDNFYGIMQSTNREI